MGVSGQPEPLTGVGGALFVSLLVARLSAERRVQTQSADWNAYWPILIWPHVRHRPCHPHTIKVQACRDRYPNRDVGLLGEGSEITPERVVIGACQ